jgi:hypothetical protein
MLVACNETNESTRAGEDETARTCVRIDGKKSGVPGSAKGSMVTETRGAE